MTMSSLAGCPAMLRRAGILAATLALLAATAAPVRAQDANPVLAKVNGVEIRQSDITAAEEEAGQLPPMAPDAKQEYLVQFLTDMILVAKAAEETGIPAEAARALEAQWKTLSPWDDARPLLESLRRTHRLGVVTNCSERLGREAAALLPVSWDVVVTAESAGVYKPDPRPYRLALEKLGLAPEKVLFVAGSGYDLIGTARVGLDTYWHNRVGLTPPPAAPAPMVESRSLAGVREMLCPGKDMP